MDLLRTLYGVIGAPFPFLSIVIACLMGAITFGGSWWLIGKQYEKEIFKQPVQAKEKEVLIYNISTEKANKSVQSSQTNQNNFTSKLNGEVNKTEKLSPPPSVAVDKYDLMYKNAMKLSLSIDRDESLIAIINSALHENNPDVAVRCVTSLSLSILRDSNYKKISIYSYQEVNFQKLSNL